MRLEPGEAATRRAAFEQFVRLRSISATARELNRLGITSHGLALYLLEGADDRFGIACLGGECFGEAGRGFLRFSCAEPNDRLQQALEFLPVALSRTERVAAYLARHPEHRLAQPYSVP